MKSVSSSEPLTIFLARHGQSTLNLEQRISGQRDVGLSAKGREQAQALRDVLSREPLTAIYASSLSRALETAGPTAEFHGLQPRALDELREISLGILEGRHADERDEAARRLWARRSFDRNGFVVAGGEIFSDFQARVLRGLELILANARGPILIVGHRNTNELILARMLGQGSAAGAEINIKNKYLYVIQCGACPDVTTIRLGGEHHGRVYPGLRT
jgi:broad specificity phosphatase PhoE